MKYNKIQERTYNSKELQIRAVEGDNKEKILEGYAALWGVRSILIDDTFYEIIEMGAADKVLAEKDLDVVFNFNHDNSLVMARTTNKTLELKSDNVGLFFRAVLPNTSYANDVYELVKRGDIFQNSFAFLPTEKGYKEEELDDGKVLITLTEIELLRDVSAVTFPAYKETTIEARKDEEVVDTLTISTDENISTVNVTSPSEKLEIVTNKNTNELDKMNMKIKILEL